MTVETENGVYDAYPLIMRKEYAQQILNRKKRVELRACSDRYGKMFFTNEYWAFLKKGCPKDEMVKFENGENMFKDDVKMVHFYNYQNSFNLDCLVQGVEMIRMTKEDIDWLCEEYNIPDDDVIHDEWREFEGVCEDKIPVMFAVVMCSIEKQKGFDPEFRHYLATSEYPEDRQMMNARPGTY